MRPPRPWVQALALTLTTAFTLALVPGARAEPPDASELVQPVLKNSAPITYPESLLEQKDPPQGRVIVKFVVGVDGVPKELEVTEALHPELDALALAAVATLRYEPATYRGQPVELVMSVAIDIAAPERQPVTKDTSQDGAPSEGSQKADGEDPGEGGDTVELDEDGPVRLSGAILEAGRRTPVVGAAVLVVPAPPDLPLGKIRRKTYDDDDEGSEPAWSVRVYTDEQGAFELRGVPDGRVQIVVLAQGFERLDYVEELAPGERLELKYFQTRLVTNPYKTTVTSRRNEPDEVVRRSISVEEINNLPGSQGDALKSIQNFPGIARAPFGIGLLVIRGSAPADSNTYLGYHRIPQLFHFGAIASVFNSDILAQIDFIPGNFDSRYGDAIGGVINVAPRKGRRDGFHGYVDADVFDIGALVEGPVGKGSWAISARRSYIDAILPAVVPEDAGLGLVQAPRYWDYQGLFDYPLGGGEFSVRLFGSDDAIALVTQGANDEEVDERNEFGTGIAFHRADLVYRKQDGPWEFLITPSYRYQVADGNGGNLFNFTLTNHDLSFRAEMTYWMTKRASLRIGTEANIGTYAVAANAPSFPADIGLGGTDIENIASFSGVYVDPALYLTATIGLGERFTLYPGVRAQHYGVASNKSAVDPRVRFSWQVADRTTLKGGVGMFSQSAEITQYAPTWGNPDLGVERSVHTSLGVAQALPLEMSLEVTGFYKYVWDRIQSSTAFLRDEDTGIRFENLDNSGFGQIFGMELLFRKALTNRLFGWVSYTLSKSIERVRPGEPYVNFGFDQPHILTLLGVYKLPRNFQIGARFRLVSGNPDTPITDGVFDAEDGGYLPLPGATNSDRLPAFHQLDIRVDKRWILRRAAFNLYLDIQNIYNRQNVETWNYSYNFQARAPTSGLPIVPSLGLRISW